MDDCWQASCSFQPDPQAQKFPNCMQQLIDHVHSKGFEGFKFGVYSDVGYKICGGRPGSLGYEDIDAMWVT